MIVKLRNYSGGYRIVSLAKDVKTRDELLADSLEVLFCEDDHCTILPENMVFSVSPEEKEALAGCCNFDVFEMDDRGNAFRYYNNESVDNAILVTNRCNSNCIMCPTAENIRRRNEEYDAETLIRLASHFPKDAPHITITGGEPFLIKKDLFRLLSYLKKNLSETSYLLLTNGRAFCSEEYASLFYSSAPEDIILGIPLHGYNSETHDSITQAKGSFKQTFSGLKNLLAFGVKIELRIVVSALNAAFITDIAKLIVDEFNTVSCVKLIGLEMTGNAAKNREKVWIRYPDAFFASKEGINLLIANGIDVGIYNFPLCSVERKYWNICEKSISDYKVKYAEICNQCVVKDACGGMFSGTIRLAKDDLQPIIGDSL